MREEQTRLLLKRADTATLEEAISIALREDFRVAKAYTKPTVVTVARSPGPEPIKINVIESSGDRRRRSHHKSDVRFGRQMVCFRCRYPGHRATEYRGPAPISAHVVSTKNVGAITFARPKTERD